VHEVTSDDVLSHVIVCRVLHWPTSTALKAPCWRLFIC